MNYLSPSDGFLGLPADPGGTFKACVIPFPLESTVSWKSGTARGPSAIIQASHQVELFDENRWCEPCQSFTLRTLEKITPESTTAAALEQLASVVADQREAGFFPLVLGGEHSLTAGAIRPFAEAFDDLVVVQLDAHADLRDGYEGEHFSHAAAMRRCLDFDSVSLVSLGIRNISSEEIPFLEANSERIKIFWGHERTTWDTQLLENLINGRPVYLTIDVDGFDSSLMPATGTPEPGGIFWDDAIKILHTVAKSGRIMGADIVELAPQEGLHTCDFLAAKLAYRVLSATSDFR